MNKLMNVTMNALDMDISSETFATFLEVLEKFSTDEIETIREALVEEPTISHDFVHSQNNEVTASGTKSSYVWKKPEMVRFIDKKHAEGVYATDITRDIKKKYKKALENEDKDEAEKWTSVLSNSGGGLGGPYGVTPSVETVRNIINRSNR